MAKKKREKESAPAGRKAQAGSEMTKFYIVLGIVAVIGIAAVGYSVSSSALSSAASEPVEVEGLDDPAHLAEVAQGVTMGDEAAPITIVEFGDYQCPGCGAFALQVKPQVEMAYVNEGTAKFVFYDFPLTSAHAHAFLAARSARCADEQGKYWEYHHALFQNQPAWSLRTSAPVGDFVRYASDLGLDADDFEACVESDRYADVVTANMRLGEELGVTGTPTVMVSSGGGMARRLPDFGFEAIQEAVESLRSGS